MSHELRTPLNNLLILAQQLYEYGRQPVSKADQVCQNHSHSCGDDLIQLINVSWICQKLNPDLSRQMSSPCVFRDRCIYRNNIQADIGSKTLRFTMGADHNLPTMHWKPTYSD